MKITVSKKISETAPLIIVPLFEDEKFSTTSLKELKQRMLTREKAKDFKAEENQSLLYVKDSKKRPQKIMLYGLGKKKEINRNKIRALAANIAKSAIQNQETRITIALPGELTKYAQELSEGVTLVNYNPSVHQTGKNKKANEKKTIKSLSIITENDEKEVREYVQKGEKIANAVNETRDLVNGPNNFVNADSMSKLAQEIAKENGYKYTALNIKQMTKLGMGAIIGVNKGSEIEGKLVIIEHKPKNAENKNPIILVGKGITFDSGGYNLKPSAGILDMKKDMGGAAAVFGVFRLLKELNINKHVIGITPLTDNLIGKSAQKVNDIVTAYNGKTIEITNTDAEGRLVMADALAYGIDKYQPSHIIDIATLTGACMVALGDRYAGLFGNDKEMTKAFKKAGKKTDELVWELPVHTDYRKKMKSRIADLKNSDGSGLAGASTAAAFLEEFVDKTKWAHLDIAGVTWTKAPKSYDNDTATGFGVRLLTQFIQDFTLE